MKSKTFSTVFAAALLLIVCCHSGYAQGGIYATIPGRLQITQPEKWYSLRTYHPFTPVRITRACLSLCQGVINGMNEAFHKDSHVFERTLGVGEISFLGSRQDLRQYDADGNHKPDLWNFTRDLHHLDEFADKYVTGGIYLSIGLSKRNHLWRDVILDCLINSAIQTAATSITYSLSTKSRLFYF